LAEINDEEDPVAVEDVGRIDHHLVLHEVFAGAVAFLFNFIKC
jgi:hypothetical protein